MIRSLPASPKFIVIEDNSSVANGHYNELGMQILSAAAAAGYATYYAGNRETPKPLELESTSTVLREFTARRMTRWSCGIDGRSKVARDESLRSIARGWRDHWLTWRDEHFEKRPLRPSTMFQCWTEGCSRILDELQPTSDDHLVLQTADDFSLLAMAHCIHQRALPRLNISAVFHFPITHDPAAADTESYRRRHRYEMQVNRALQLLAAHHVQLFATTPGLTDHLNAGAIQQPFRCMAYPVRPLPVVDAVHSIPVLTIGGIQRTEQGSGSLGGFLESIHQPFLSTGRIRLALQLCPRRWKRHIPKSLHTYFEVAVAKQSQTNALLGNDVYPQSSDAVLAYPTNLAPQQFHRMLSASDAILFLYDPQRYRMRCSSVLLETMAMGIPAIVPNGCSLSEKVRELGTEQLHRLIYDHTTDLSRILAFALNHLTSIKSEARIARRQLIDAHSASHWLQQLTSTSQLARAA